MTDKLIEEAIRKILANKQRLDEFEKWKDAMTRPIEAVNKPEQSGSEECTVCHGCGLKYKEAYRRACPRCGAGPESEKCSKCGGRGDVLTPKRGDGDPCENECPDCLGTGRATPEKDRYPHRKPKKKNAVTGIPTGGPEKTEPVSADTQDVPRAGDLVWWQGYDGGQRIAVRYYGELTNGKIVGLVKPSEVSMYYITRKGKKQYVSHAGLIPDWAEGAVQIEREDK